ncbi:glycoside hydrolase family 32 protein [Gaetbulibacter aestuarii]|uniref:Glycoside hydrolase family 32 protein n=1 Tax=Gaetbulibacter aestuarii TaxID=1502358 RepID=A0ABW7MYW8_9FLAO
MRHFLIYTLALFTFVSCKYSDDKNTERSSVQDATSYTLEQYRPRFHFTPKAHWMNDPNGLVYSHGTYHLFYQYYPDSTVWGPMHWGHAVSKDMLHWKPRPIALKPDSLGYIFSGSAVIDKQNTSGFGANAMIAIFTYHDPVKEKQGAIDTQTQGIAYSLDKGETWTKYKHNPVIKNPGITDFRDPKVFWNDETNSWQMALVAKDHVEFYESANLKDWKKLSDFRFPDDPPLGVWECPDLFKMRVGDTDEEKWVLIVSHGGNSAPNGGSGTRYFVGDYNGKTFTTDQKQSQWIDYGTDNYAGVTYNNVPNNERLFIGWMSNWEYAQTTPTTTWRSAMTLPRSLSLIKSNNRYILKSQLLDTFKSIIKPVEEGSISGHLPYDFTYEKLQESFISFHAEIKDSLQIQFSNSKGEHYTISYHKDSGVLSADRSQSGLVDFNPNYKNFSFQTIPVGVRDSLSFKIVLDASSIELFINDGVYALTNQIFPTEPYTAFQINSDVTISNFEIKQVENVFDL